jgi:hypothetical protein
MRHRVLQLLQCSNQHTDVCHLARAACGALVGSSANVTCSALQHVRSASSSAAQQHIEQQQCQQQQQKRGLLPHEQHWLSQLSFGLQQRTLAAQQHQDGQETSSSSRSKEETSSNEGVSKGTTSSGEPDGSSTSSDQAGESGSSGSGSSSGRDPPDEALLAEWRSASAQWYGNGLNYIVQG